ncbi:MAG: site-specific integrase [Ruminococcaceae bacterium]|nr:site-specific integrase [Oscillospiraceae bacterium]
MTGSLTIKNGKYYAVLNVYENGKRKKKWISTDLPEKGNKRKAEQILREKLAEYERMEGIVNNDILFCDYVRVWLDHSSRKVDSVTMQSYELIANRHIIPYFSDTEIKLSDIDHKAIQRFIDTKAKNGRLDGKGGLSPRSLKHLKNIVNQTLNLALQNKLIASNPCQFVILPQINKYQSKFYTEKQLKALFSALADDPMFPLVKITLLYGLRRSELLGLQWDSIDFDRGTITIQHTVSKVTKVVAKNKTKNASSHRTFPLIDDAAEIFKAAKCQETQNRIAFGREYKENTYVFKWADGHPYSPDYISERFRNLLKKHNLPHIRFHDLRHSCASMLLSMGWNLKDIQEWLGHSDIKMTANLYSHLDIDRKCNIANSLGDMFKA